MSHTQQDPYIALVAWDHDGFGFEGEITEVPSVRATAPTMAVLMGRLGTALYQWLTEQGQRPQRKDLEITAVRVDG